MRITGLSISNYRSFRFEHQDSFSSSVNIIAGPNSAGKTNFLNAIRKCFDRGTYTSQIQIGESPSDFYDPDEPIHIKISFEDLSNTVGDLSYYHSSPDEEPVRNRNGEKVDDVQSSKWKEFKRCLFPSSFPRRLDNRFAHNIAFDGKQLKNWEAINKAWTSIREDAKQYIDLRLDEEPPKEPPPPPECPQCRAQIGYSFIECPCCRERISQPQYASDLLDKNDRQPLLEGSDGHSHFLYIIMEIRKHPWSTVFLIEEPDVFMHPGLQKNFLKYLLYVSERAKHQFFISTHSPYLLDFALRSEKIDSPPHVYRIFKEDGKSHLKFMNPADRSDAWETLRELGHSPADVLHPNGIIWVEGPSDKIYLQSWLDGFTREKENINWGVDCDIVWYGGSNLAHLDAKFWQKAEEDDVEKLLDLLKINPQAAILVDRDDYPKAKEKMKEHKRRVKQHCEEKGILFWMTEEGKRTIEDYIPDSVRERLRIKEKDRKVENARKYQQWVDENKQDDAYDDIIPPSSHLEEQIRRLYELIMSWRGDSNVRKHPPAQ